MRVLTVAVASLGGVSIIAVAYAHNGSANTSALVLTNPKTHPFRPAQPSTPLVHPSKSAQRKSKPSQSTNKQIDRQTVKQTNIQTFACAFQGAGCSGLSGGRGRLKRWEGD